MGSNHPWGRPAPGMRTETFANAHSNNEGGTEERPAQKGSGSGEDAGAVSDGDHVGTVPDTKFATDSGQVALHGQW